MATRTAAHPAIASGRLAAYLYPLERDPDARITSGQLAAATNTNATQVRRDLSEALGHTGTRGLGYPARDVAAKIRSRLNGSSGSPGLVLVAAALDNPLSFPMDDEIGELAARAALIVREIDRHLLEEVTG